MVFAQTKIAPGSGKRGPALPLRSIGAMAVRARPVEKLPARGDRFRPAAERVHAFVNLRH